MKKVLFISFMAFDANISIVKQLKKRYDVWFMAICNIAVESRVGKISLKDDITCVEKIENFQMLKDFLDLEKTFIIRHYKKKRVLNKIKLDIKLKKKIDLLNPDAILVDTYCFPYTLLNHSDKVISLIHDPFLHTGEKNWRRHFFYKFVKKFSARYILFNESQKQDFISKYRINPKCVYVAFLSVYEMLSIYDDGIGEHLNHHNIFFWGRISPYKGIEYLIAGFRKYIRDSGDKRTILTIAGAGDYYFDVDKAVGTCSQITILKRSLSMNEMVKMIKECYVVICPYTDATQSGVIMSAFAMKKPVIATHVGGLPEMLDNGNAGMLIVPKDSHAICLAIKKIIVNPELVQQYTNNIEKLYFNGGNRSWEKSIEVFSLAIESIAVQQ